MDTVGVELCARGGTRVARASPRFARASGWATWTDAGGRREFVGRVMDFIHKYPSLAIGGCSASSRAAV